MTHGRLLSYGVCISFTNLHSSSYSLCLLSFCLFLSLSLNLFSSPVPPSPPFHYLSVSSSCGRLPKPTEVHPSDNTFISKANNWSTVCNTGQRRSKFAGSCGCHFAKKTAHTGDSPIYLLIYGSGALPMQTEDGSFAEENFRIIQKGDFFCCFA